MIMRDRVKVILKLIALVTSEVLIALWLYERTGRTIWLWMGAFDVIYRGWEAIRELKALEIE